MTRSFIERFMNLEVEETDEKKNTKQFLIMNAYKLCKGFLCFRTSCLRSACNWLQIMPFILQTDYLSAGILKVIRLEQAKLSSGKNKIDSIKYKSR